ncbi:MAG: MFS transporter [Anaerovoracaceae bacterium]|jgi:FSR family fosmidomycin resistance protein-like MFS transporter
MKTNRYSYLMMFGHICTDLNQGALPAILPFLITQYGLSYTSAAGLVFASNLISSVVQPLFGFLGDRASKPGYMALGILLAGGGISLIGLLPSYWMIFIAAMIYGTGVAMFHPEGGKLANLVAGENKGAGMSIFAVGGNLGFALGPIVASLSILTCGLKGTIIFIVPATIMSIIFLYTSKILQGFLKEDRERRASSKKDDKGQEPAKDDWNSFNRVTSLVFCRSIINYGLVTFIPLYLVGVMLESNSYGNMALSIYSLSAAFATLVGGRMADRFGFQRIIKLGSLALFPFIFLSIQMNNSLGAIIFFALAAFAFGGSHSTLIALGQAYLPNRMGLASGILLGLTVSIGGMAAPGIGKIGDIFGLTAAMYTIAGVAFVGILITFLLPKSSTEAQ